VAKTQITGIGGVLGEIISPEADEEKQAQPECTKKAKHSRARTGRPPGKGTSKSPRREKLTVRIDADLIEKYRDWSWDARCNLGELVGQAMQIHLKKHRSRK
jgi:uncharacterized protein (DUF4415 family)